MPNATKLIMILDRELDTILGLLKCYIMGAPAPIVAKPGLDWQRLLQLCNVHRVTPLVHRLLKASEGVPAAVLEKWRGIVLNQSAMTIRAAHELTRLLDSFRAVGKTVIPFKGHVLAAELYDDATQRPGIDFDLYVAKKHIPDILQALSELGYTSSMLQHVSGRSVTSRFYSLEFSHPTKTPIDLHWDITDGYVSRLLSSQQLTGAVRPFEFGGRTIEIFDQNVTLALLAVHGGKASWASLSAWMDLALFFRRFPHYSYSTVLHVLRERGVARMLYVGAHLVERFFDVPAPRLIKQNMDYRSVEISRLIGHRLFEQPLQPAAAGWRKVLLNLQLREKSSEKLRYLWFKARPKKVDVAARGSAGVGKVRRVIGGAGKREKGEGKLETENRKPEAGKRETGSE